MGKLFHKAITLEVKIESFLDCVTNAGFLFREGIEDYIKGNNDRFQSRLKEIAENENNADKLRREICYRLYKKMLIPESRGDVLGLLENTDNVIDATKDVLVHFSIEKPKIRKFLRSDFLKLADSSEKALDNVVRANRAFFDNKENVQDYIYKVYVFEEEADDIEEKIKKEIFESKDISDLSEKLQLRDFVELIASISDESEEVAERLSVSAIKRSI